jgi:hypothetical protein
MAPEAADTQSPGAGSPPAALPPAQPDPAPSPDQPRRGRKRWILTCLVLGCLTTVVVALGLGGCLGFGAWHLGKAIGEQERTEARLRQAHGLLEQRATAGGGAFPAAFDGAGELAPGGEEYVYVPGLRQDMPGSFVLVYRRYVAMGATTVAVVTIAGTVTALSVSEFDELLAAQDKALEALKAGGKAAEEAVRAFEALAERQAAARAARESRRSHHSHHDWD